MEFGFGDKLAPRLGASYDVRGDGRFKVYGSWGRYYDWTKYELSRGVYGGDTWQIYYRGLETTDVGSLNLSNMPGADLWVVPGSFRDRRVPNFDSTDPDIKPMYQDSTSIGTEFQIGTQHVVRGALRAQQPVADHRGHRRGGCVRQRDVHHRQPGTRPGDDPVPVGRDAGRLPGAGAEAAVRRARTDRQPPLREQLLLERELRLQPAVRQLLGPRGHRGSEHADDQRDLGDGAAAGRQHRAPRRQRQPRLGHRRDLLGFARRRSTCSAACRPIVRTSSSCMAAT